MMKESSIIVEDESITAMILDKMESIATLKDASFIELEKLT